MHQQRADENVIVARSDRMSANAPSEMLAHASASSLRVDDGAVPSYLQRYAAELESWHAHRQAADGHTVRLSTTEPDERTGTQSV
jgi:hypothetical protein